MTEYKVSLKFLFFIFNSCYILCKLLGIKVNKMFLLKLFAYTVFVNIIFTNVFELNIYLMMISTSILVIIDMKKNYNKNIFDSSILMMAAFTFTIIVYSFIATPIIGIVSYTLFFNEQPTFIDLRIIDMISFSITVKYFSKDKYKKGITLSTRIYNLEKKIMWLLMTITIIVFITMILWDIVHLEDNNVFIARDYLYFSTLLNVVIISFYITTLFKHNFKLRANEQSINNLQEQLKEKDSQIERFAKTSKLSHDTNHKLDVIIDKLSNMKQNDILKELTELRSTYRSEMDHINNKTLLQSTNIEKVDIVLNHMFKECERNNISFLLKVNGSVNYIVKNYISEDELVTLLSDHIKNAIISINNSDNTFKSILITIGEIGDYYGVIIFDSGKAFKVSTLVNLGLKPATTYKNKGGTGIGFITTFDTLKKTEASLIITELEPSENSYTKSIAIQFDNFNSYKIISYRNKEIKAKNKKNQIHFD